MLRRLLIATSALAAVSTAAACGSTAPQYVRPAAARSAPKTDTPTAPSTRATTRTLVPTPGSSTSMPVSSAPAPTGSALTPPRTSARQQLPRGGTRLLGRMRIVAYYGAPGTGALGVLGATSPEQAAHAVIARAASYSRYGLPVQPAMELIATVAQPRPGADGTYSRPIPTAQIARYLAVAHEHRMLLILDLQPGRASFLGQAQALAPFLRDPSVELALDPEWKVTSGAPGGGRIGSSSASGINAVGAWLSRLVARDHLPDKLLVVHEFTATMLPDRQDITQHRGVEMVLHADGFGSPGVKIAVFHKLAFPHPPFGIGFKLFLRQDPRLMSPAQVMALRPRPDVITYQ